MGWNVSYDLWESLRPLERGLQLCTAQNSATPARVTGKEARGNEFVRSLARNQAADHNGQ